MSLVAALAAFGLSTATVSALTVSHTAFIDEDTITIDGDFSDWPAGSQVIDEDGALDVEGESWCWDEAEQTWDDTITSADDCVDSFFYTEAGQLDLQTGYFGTSANNMYVGFTTAIPMMAVLDTTTDEYDSVFALPFQGVTTLPQAFDHAMVFSFGPSDEATYDYYLVAKMDIAADLTEEMNGGVGLQVYQESGDTVGFQEDEDTLLGTIDMADSESSVSGEDSGEGLTTAFEVRQNIEAFFELTGMSAQDYGFRIETHSDSGDVSDRVVVDFDSTPDTVKQAKMKVKKLKAYGALLKWPEIDNATYYMVQLRTKAGKRLKTWNAVQTNKKLVTKAMDLLAPDKHYKFRVKACSDTVCGDYSKYKKFTTPATY